MQQSVTAGVTKTHAVLQKIFSGIQGEGLLVGCRHIFVRFCGCHLDCRYCDTPAAGGAMPAACQIERHAGTRVMGTIPNPLTPPQLFDVIERLQAGFPHQAISLTGGEPLLHHRFLDALSPLLREDGWSDYLETNGQLPEALAALAVMPHYLAMDIKLPSAAGPGADWERSAEFLTLAYLRLRAEQAAPVTDRLQVKVVFAETSLPDIEHAAAMVAAEDPALPLVLQPLTPHPGAPPAPTPATVLEAQRIAANFLRTVRVIPQTHVMLGQW